MMILSSVLFGLGFYAAYSSAGPSQKFSKDESSNLQMIAAVFRHGDRTPVGTYPLDPYKNYNWPEGLGSLTKKGSSQLFTLGKTLRTRYYSLLPKEGFYTQSNLEVQSSYAPRCLMSAQSLLAAFLPPDRDENLLPINWQPVPVQYVPPSQDILIAQSRSCEKYDYLLNLVTTFLPSDLKKMLESNRDIFEIIKANTGIENLDLGKLVLLYDVLRVYQAMGLQLPQWTKGIFPDRMDSIFVRWFLLLTETEFMKKVKGGAFVSHLHNIMVNKRNDTLQPDRNIFLFSGHDITLVNVLNALNVFDQVGGLPDYGATLVFELHKNRSLKKDMEVRILYYKDSEATTPQPIIIPKCNRPCSLTNFGKAVQHLLFTDFDELCKK